jgi:hypothetical protein
MKTSLICVVLFLFGFTLYAQKLVVSTASEIDKLGSIQDLPVYWDGTTVKQVSSYDTTGKNDDGFSGKYSFIRKNKDSSLVIFEDKGNGVVNRIWTPTPTDDILDIYFGGAKKPSYSIKFSDLFSGKVYPFIAPLVGNELGGFFCYLPIAYKNGCKIVSRGKKMEFYQIQYRTYPKEADVKNFNPQLDKLAQDALTRLSKTWSSVTQPTGQAHHKEGTLRNGESITLAELRGGGRITGIQLHHSDAFRGLNKNIFLRITWDNESQPAVFAPVADFFGYAYGKESMQSLLLGSSDNTNYIYFPMPFEKNAKVELIYLDDQAGSSPKSINVDADIYTADGKYNALKEGKFYAYWNPEKHTKPGVPHTFLQGKGKGHYVGTILQAQGLTPGMTLFFEGDDATRIDGELRIHGTGSEDYFNGGWYALLDRWDRKMSLPLHGSLDYSLPFARTGGYRLFISDKMPFEKEIDHSIEHGPEENNKPGDYTSMAFYYAGKSVATNQPQPNMALTKVYIPDTLMVYPQLMQYTVSGAVQIDGNIIRTTTGGQVKIDLSEIPKGKYKLYSDMEKSPDGGSIMVWQRQKKLTDWISFHAEKKSFFQANFLADIDIDDFKNAITLHIKQDSLKSVVNISRLILIRQH